ncbi:MAG: 6-phosphofructokinase, partial [Victivallaceae bacterium]
DLDIEDKDFREHNRRTALILNNEYANPTYTTDVICSIFNEEGKGFFDARKVVLGPMQQGGVPSPADRIMAIRLSNFAVNELVRLANGRRSDECGFVGRSNGVTKLYRWSEFSYMANIDARRPDSQWWMILERMIKALAIRPERLNQSDEAVK